MANVNILSITKVVYLNNAVTMNIEVNRELDDIEEIAIKAINSLVDIDSKLREMQLEKEPQPLLAFPVEKKQEETKKPYKPKKRTQKPTETAPTEQGGFKTEKKLSQSYVTDTTARTDLEEETKIGDTTRQNQPPRQTT
jgi:hypothetical protein